MRSKNRAQSTVEYAVIIGVVVTALLAINIYMKRGIQGKLRESTDQIGEQFDAQKTTITDMVRTHTGKTIQTTKDGATSSDTTDDVRTQKGQEQVDAW